MHLIKWNKITS